METSSSNLANTGSLNELPLESFSPTPGESTINTQPFNLFTYLSTFTWQFWVIVVLVLSLIGINIFAYLAQGTQETTNIISRIFAPLLKLIGYDVLEATKQAVTTGATGAKAGVTFAEDVVVGGIDAIESGAKKNDTTKDDSQVADPLPPLPKGYSAPNTTTSAAQKQTNMAQIEETTLDKALANAAQTSTIPEPNSVGGSAGWCYIGTDNGVRTCGEVGVNDQCMSGDIFPSQDICVNPQLRA